MLSFWIYTFFTVTESNKSFSIASVETLPLCFTVFLYFILYSINPFFPFYSMWLLGKTLPKERDNYMPLLN